MRQCIVQVRRVTMKHIYVLLIHTIIQVHTEIVINKVADICGYYNNRKIYLEYGDSGRIEAQFAKLRDRIGLDNSSRVVEHVQCSIELITCPSCIIQIEFKYVRKCVIISVFYIFNNFSYLNISKSCNKNSVVDGCGCDYVWIYEPPYEEVSGEQYCGEYVLRNETSLGYTSQTRSTSIHFFHSTYHEHAFTLTYTSLREYLNRYYLFDKK